MPLFRRELAGIDKNSDCNIDPWKYSNCFAESLTIYVRSLKLHQLNELLIPEKAILKQLQLPVDRVTRLVRIFACGQGD
jgi:hypothetical protein